VITNAFEREGISIPDHDFQRQIKEREMNPIVNKMIENGGLEYTDVY
jgi:hypothetical protein